MKKKLRKIFQVIIAVVIAISSITVFPITNVKAADIPSFIVKVSSNEVKKGDIIHVELWVEDAEDIISFVGNVNLDPNVYTVDRESVKYGELYMLSDKMGGMPQIVSNNDQSYSILLDFMGPVKTSGMVFSFDVTVNENASGTGAIYFEYIGGERGKSDGDRQDVPASDIIVSTRDTDGNVIENGIIPVVIELESITLDKAEPFTMARGSKDKLSVIATPEAALNGKSIKWSSSNEKIVSVDESGNITAIGVGTATVMAKVEDCSASVDITVAVPTEDIALDGIAFKKEITPLEEGKTAQLEIVFDPENTTVDRNVIWETSEPSVATVEDGMLEALKVGTTIISAKVEDKKISYKLTVIKRKENSDSNEDASGNQKQEEDGQADYQSENDVAKTGDGNNVFGVLLILIVSLTMIIVRVFKGK